jgi:hypothetical protein
VRLALSAGRAFLVPDTDWVVNGREVRRAILRGEQLRVQDDGDGCSASAVSNGTGIATMRAASGRSLLCHARKTLVSLACSVSCVLNVKTRVEFKMSFLCSLFIYLNSLVTAHRVPEHAAHAGFESLHSLSENHSSSFRNRTSTLQAPTPKQNLNCASREGLPGSSSRVTCKTMRP